MAGMLAVVGAFLAVAARSPCQGCFAAPSLCDSPAGLGRSGGGTGGGGSGGEEPRASDLSSVFRSIV